MAAVLTALPTRPTAMLAGRAVPVATATVMVPEAAYLTLLAERDQLDALAADLLALLVAQAAELDRLRARVATLAVLASPEHGAL